MSLEYFLEDSQKAWIDSLAKNILFFFNKQLDLYMSLLNENFQKSINQFLKSLLPFILYTLGIVGVFILIFQPFAIEFIREYHDKNYWIYITLLLCVFIGFLLWKITNHSMKAIDVFFSLFVLIIPIFLKIIIWFLLSIKKGPLAAIGLVFLIISFFLRYQNL